MSLFQSFTFVMSLWTISTDNNRKLKKKELKLDPTCFNYGSAPHCRETVWRKQQKLQCDLKVVELEGFGVVGVEVVSNEDDSGHQYDQQQHADAHPRLVTHMHLQSQSKVKGH